MTTIALHHTAAELRAAVAVAKAGAATKAEHITVNLADQLLAMIDAGGTWTLDDRGTWIEITQLDADYLDRIEAPADAYGGVG